MCEGNEIVKCLREEGGKEKYRICFAYNEEYKILRGKCIPYSFKADYAYLINKKYIHNIVNMIIDGNETNLS